MTFNETICRVQQVEILAGIDHSRLLQPHESTHADAQKTRYALAKTWRTYEPPKTQSDKRPIRIHVTMRLTQPHDRIVAPHDLDAKDPQKQSVARHLVHQMLRHAIEFHQIFTTRQSRESGTQRLPSIPLLSCSSAGFGPT